MGDLKCREGRLRKNLDIANMLDMDAEMQSVTLGSPLQLISPNIFNKNNDSFGRLFGESPSSGAKEAGKAKAVDTRDTRPDALGPLVQFSKKRIDPRRQSTAIFSAFEATSNAEGLLGDSELALAPDDDLLIPLTKGNNALAAKGSSLWVDPDTDEILESDLPEPALTFDFADGDADLPMETDETNSKTRVKTPKHLAGIRDSHAIFAGFDETCRNSPGLDDILDDGPEIHLLPSKPEEEQTALAKTSPANCPTTNNIDVSGKDMKQPTLLRPTRLRPPTTSSRFFSQNSYMPSKSERSVAGAFTGTQTGRRDLVHSFPQTSTSENFSRAQECGAGPSEGSKVAKVHKFKKPEMPTQRARPPPSTTHARTSRLKAPSSLAKNHFIAASQQDQQTAPAKSTTSDATITALSLAMQVQAKEDTPRTAHLRWLEQHPELAFGGGSKISNSPGIEQGPKKKDTMQLHYEAWGDSISALNESAAALLKGSRRVL